MESYSQGPINVTAREARYGEYCSINNAVKDDQIYPAAWLAGLKGMDAVVHLAAHQDYLPNFSKFFHTNAAGTAANASKSQPATTHQR